MTRILALFPRTPARALGLALCLPLALAPAQAESGKPAAPWPYAWTMFAFDHPAELAAWHARPQTRKALVPSPWPGHGKALSIVFEPLADGQRHWPALICSGAAIRLPPQPQLYHYLLFHVKNTGKNPAFFYLHFRNARGARFSTPHAPWSWTLAPGEEREIVFCLDRLRQVIPLSQIREFHIVTDTPKRVFRLVIDDIRLAPGLGRQADSVLDVLRRTRRSLALRIPRGDFRTRTEAELFELDARLAALRREFSLGKDSRRNPIPAWEAALDSLHRRAIRLRNAIRIEPGKARARRAIRRLRIADDWILGTESSMVKVAWNALPFLGEFGRPLSLDGARGETVHGQVVIVPTATALHHITWRLTPLRGPNGREIHAQVRVVGFLHTARPGAYEVPFAGWWPDPLLDFLHTFDLPATAQQPLWITVNIPRNAAPGEYRGTLRVAPRGRRPQALPIHLRVRRFAIPRRRHLRLAVNYEERVPARIYGKAWTPALKWRYREFLLNHRFNVDSIYQILPMWNESTDSLKRLKEGGQNFITAAVFNNTNAPGWQKHVLAFKKRAEAAGVADICWFYGFDESPPALRKAILYHAAACRRIWPQAHVMTTASPELMRDPAVRKVIDAWCPTTEGWDRYRNEIEKVRAEGGQVWYYVCVGPKHPYANLFIEYPAIEARLLLGFMAWKSHTGGFLYYSLNRAPKNDHPIDHGPLCDWNPASYDDYNGDGCLFYCGKDGPVTTIRFENLRDGIEDYEVCWLLAQRIEQAERNAAWTAAHRRALARARQALRIPDNLVRNFSDYTLDPDRLQAYRRILYDAVESLPPLKPKDDH